MSYKPIANMIRSCVVKLLLFGILSVILILSAILIFWFGENYSAWGFLFMIPTAFCCWMVYDLKNELKDYLISI